MSQITFQYQAIDAQGAKTKGMLNAANQQDAYRKLLALGLKPLHIANRRGRVRGRGRKVTLKDISQLTFQFSVLTESRIPLVDGLRSIVDQEQNTRLRTVVEDVANQIEGGVSVTEALGPHRALFGEVYVESVRAAEASGNMVEVLARLAEMLDRQHQIAKDVKGALMYPACVVGALTLAVTFLMIFVIPRFATMFESRGVELPLPTQFVMGFSGVLRSYWYLFLGGGAAAGWGVRKAWRHPVWRGRIDTGLHSVPFVKEVLRGMAVSRFANVLGICLRSGLSLIDALEISGRASGRPLMQADSQYLRDQVNRGGRLSDSINNCHYLPAFTRRMIASGEEAGEVPKMCDIIARNYDREVTQLAKNVTTVIEPVLIVGLAGVVLVIALAIFLPLWNMAALMG